MRIKLAQLTICVIISVISIGLILAIFKGRVVGGKLDYQSSFSTEVGGPYELSNSTARYALTQAIVEKKTFFLDEKSARFAAPDVVDYQGKFLSIFTPGVSFLAIPFYLVGKYFAAPQVGAYAINSIFILIDGFLIFLLARRLGGKTFSSILSGLIFTFGTNALPYSQTFAQHILSAALIVSMLLLVTSKKSYLLSLLAGALFGLGILVDFPNAIMALPLIFFILAKTFSMSREKITNIKFDASKAIFWVGFVPLFLITLYYNYATTGSITKLAQSIGRTDKFNVDQPVQKLSKSPEVENNSTTKFKLSSILPFNTRRQLNGFYILGVSDERAWLYYSPILLIGFFGLILASRQQKTKALAVLAISISIIDLVIYASFGDPWGGWAFGPRYLIPAAALAAAGFGFIFEKFKYKLLFWFIFLPLLLYSVFTNILGALTTNAIPPKIEAVTLPEPIPYTQKYNQQLLQKGLNSSLIYNEFFYKSVESIDYVFGIFISASVLLTMIAVLGLFEKERIKENV